MMSKIIGLAEAFLLCLSKALRQLKKMDTCGKIAVITTAMLFLPFFLGGLGVVVASVYVLTRRELRTKIFSVRWSIFLFLFSALTLVVSVCYLNWRGIVGAVGIFLLFVYALFMRVVMNERLYHYLMKVICGLSIVSALYAMTQLWHILPLNPLYRGYSTFFNPNYYATIAEFIIFVCFYQLFFVKKGRAFYLTALLFNVVGLASTGCRSAWMGVVAGLIVMLFLLKRYRLVLGIIGFALAVLAAGYLWPDLIPRFDSVGASAIDRFRIWESGLWALEDCLWFGKGLYTYYYSCLHQTVDFMVNKPHSHNLYLDFLLNFGIIGCSLLMVYLTGTVVGILKKVRQGCKNKVWILMAGVFVSILAHGIMDVTILGVETSIMMLVLFSGVGIYDRYHPQEALAHPR